MTISILGAGNMGGSTALGLVASGRVSAADITVTAAHEATLEKFRKAGMNATLDNAAAAEAADIIVIAVKPWFVQKVVEEIRPVIDCSRQVVVNFAAGLDPEFLPGLLTDARGEMPQLLNVIPNTAIEIRQSMTFIEPVKAEEETVALVEDIFRAVGETMVVNAKQLAAGMALASCGIAYAMRYIHAAAQGGVELGMRPAEAVRTVCQTVIGAAELLASHGSHPEAEIDKVTTPGGITIKGLNEMEHAGFSSAVIRGLKASKP